MSLSQSMEELFDKIQHLPLDRVAEVEDFVDFLRTRTQEQQAASKMKRPLNFPVLHIEDWPQDLTLSRDEIYDQDGR